MHASVWESAQVLGGFSQKSEGHTTCDSRGGGASSYGEELQIIL